MQPKAGEREPHSYQEKDGNTSHEWQDSLRDWRDDATKEKLKKLVDMLASSLFIDDINPFTPKELRERITKQLLSGITATNVASPEKAITRDVSVQNSLSRTSEHLPEGLQEWFDQRNADQAAWEAEQAAKHAQRQLQQQTDDYSDL